MLHCFGQKPRAVMQSTMFFYFSLLFMIFLFILNTAPLVRSCRKLLSHSVLGYNIVIKSIFEEDG